MSNRQRERQVPIPGNPAKYDSVQVPTPSPVRRKRTADLMAGNTPEPRKIWMAKQLRPGANPSPKARSISRTVVAYIYILQYISIYKDFLDLSNCNCDCYIYIYMCTCLYNSRICIYIYIYLYTVVKALYRNLHMTCRHFL